MSNRNEYEEFNQLAFLCPICNRERLTWEQWKKQKIKEREKQEKNERQTNS